MEDRDLAATERDREPDRERDCDPEEELEEDLGLREWDSEFEDDLRRFFVERDNFLLDFLCFLLLLPLLKESSGLSDL